MLDNKKARELRLVEHVRTICDWIPPGPLQPDEEPDVLLRIGLERLGIEVTQLHEPATNGEFPRREVESFHVEVMKRAEQLHAASGEPPLDVLVYFGKAPLRDVNRTAAELVQFVNEHPPGSGCETFNQGAYAGFAVVRIVSRYVQEPRWRCGEGGSVPILTYELLGAAIEKKNRRVRAYRRKADRVWLLLASPIAPFSSSFAVPREVTGWRFRFDFDRVLLYSWEDGVIDIARVIPALTSAASPLPVR